MKNEDNLIDLEQSKLKRIRNAKYRRSDHGFLLWLVIVVIILATILYFILDMAKIKDVIVSGNQHYTDEQVMAMIDVGEGSNAVDVFFL